MKKKINATDLEKAIALIKNKKIIKIQGQEIPKWIVKGKNGDYLVVNKNFCTCEHFTIRCLQTKNTICYHIYATQIAENLQEQNIESDRLLKILFRNSTELLNQ